MIKDKESAEEYLPTEVLASSMMDLALSSPNLPLEEFSRSLARAEGRHDAMAFADGYFIKTAMEDAPKVSVKIFEYSGKSLAIKAFATFFAPERFFTSKNLLLDSDFSSEM